MEKLNENVVYTRLEKILTELEIEYKKIDSKTDSIYVAKINMNLSSNENMKVQILLLSSSNNKDLLIMCPNIYKLKKEDTTLGLLVGLNRVNSKLSGGTVTLEDEGMVIYKRFVHFDRVDSLNKSKMENLFNDVIASIIYTSEEVKNLGKSYE